MHVGQVKEEVAWLEVVDADEADDVIEQPLLLQCKWNELIFVEFELYIFWSKIKSFF